VRHKKEIIRRISTLLKAKNLSPKEEKRLRIYLEKKRKLDAMPQQLCKNPKCDKMIPIPAEFCSTDCRQEYEVFRVGNWKYVK